MLKNLNLLLNVLLAIGIIFLSGCNEQENKNVEFMSSAIQVNSNEQEHIALTEEEAREIGISVGLKDRELLSAVSEPDEPAILVNGIAITNRTIAYQKALQLYPGMRTLKEEIISMIEENKFIPYCPGLINLLFETRKQYGALMRKDI